MIRLDMILLKSLHTPCMSIGKRDGAWKRHTRLDRKREPVCGKEPKEPLESTEEMRQRENGETGQTRGGTKERGEV